MDRDTRYPLLHGCTINGWRALACRDGLYPAVYARDIWHSSSRQQGLMCTHSVKALLDDVSLSAPFEPG
ncbi:hypothetical protein BDZ89DRAFT_1071786 [Hymenopellis radicata]|nr:hypothetical protein BDZ89DRAFT_1071786 [Hymenopellis radicata]